MPNNHTAYIVFNPESGALLAWGKTAFHAVLAADQHAPFEPIRVFPAGDIEAFVGHRRLIGDLSSGVFGALQALEAL